MASTPGQVLAQPLATLARALASHSLARGSSKPAGGRRERCDQRPGVYVVGDLTGIPLLKFSVDWRARGVGDHGRQPLQRRARQRRRRVRDLVIIGAGVSGVSAALEAKKSGLDFVLLRGDAAVSTVANFPKGKPILHLPAREMTPAGELQFSREIKRAAR